MNMSAPVVSILHPTLRSEALSRLRGGMPYESQVSLSEGSSEVFERKKKVWLTASKMQATKNAPLTSGTV
jgi:hypothetical protein